MKLFSITCTLVIVASTSCRTKSATTSDSSSAKPQAGKTCSAAELQKMNEELKSSESLYQQTCLAYADKTGDINLVHLLAATPLGLMNQMLAKILHKPVQGPTGPLAPLRWDPKFLSMYPFDLNTVNKTPQQFTPNGGQKIQLSLPGYAQFAELNRDKVFVGRKPSIDPYRFLKMFAAIVNKTKIAPFVGDVHQFVASPSELENHVNKNGDGYYGGQLLGLTRENTIDMVNKKAFSKLFAALSLGVTSRVMYTGGERTILEFLASKPDSSVQFHELFELAYRMHNGDVYLTLLTLENTFSRWWREPERQNLLSTRKLANITNAYLGKDDRYGAWYHFFGISLLGLVEGDFAATVADVESAGSRVLNTIKNTPEDEAQEDIINSSGALFGIRLGQTLKEISAQPSAQRISFLAQKYSVNSADEIGRALMPDNYLVLDEDFRDRLIMPNSPALHATVTEQSISLTHSTQNLSKCLVEVFPVNTKTKKRDSQLLRKFPGNLGSTPQQFALTAWPTGSISLAGSRVLVSGCQEIGNTVLVTEVPL
jgi:hypothetical protein